MVVDVELHCMASSSASTREHYLLPRRAVQRGHRGHPQTLEPSHPRVATCDGDGEGGIGVSVSAERRVAKLPTVS